VIVPRAFWRQRLNKEGMHGDRGSISLTPRRCTSRSSNDIRNMICPWDLQPGDKLPTHQELAKKYKVQPDHGSRVSNNLVKEEVLYTRMGKGTYVAEQSLGEECVAG